MWVQVRLTDQEPYFWNVETGAAEREPPTGIEVVWSATKSSSENEFYYWRDDQPDLPPSWDPPSASPFAVAATMRGYTMPHDGWIFRQIHRGRNVPTAGLQSGGAGAGIAGDSLWVKVLGAQAETHYFWEIVTNTSHSELPAGAQATWKAFPGPGGRYFYQPFAGGQSQWEIPLPPSLAAAAGYRQEAWEADCPSWLTQGRAVSIERCAEERYNGQVGYVTSVRHGHAAIKLPDVLGDTVLELPFSCFAPVLQRRATESNASTASSSSGAELRTFSTPHFLIPNCRISGIELDKAQEYLYWKCEQRGEFLSANGERHQFDIVFPTGLKSSMLIARKAGTAAQSWPLVVHLHGHGGGSLFNALKKTIKSEGLQFAASRFTVVSPVCTWKWSDTPLEPKLWVVELVRHLRAASWVDTSRVYLTGCSMGGMGTWEIGSAAPELFAAISPIAAHHIPERREYFTERLFAMPILALHCTDDTTCPLNGEEEIWSAMTARGNEGLEVLCTKGVEHCNVFKHAYCDTDYLWEWLLRHAGPAHAQVSFRHGHSTPTSTRRSVRVT